jgi:YfiH family protein
LKILQAARLAEFAWLAHAFSTRPGGQSRLEGQEVLNLGFAGWDSRAAVLANRKRFLAALGAEEMRLVTLRQSHSDEICHLVELPAQPFRGDAAVTRTPGLLLAIETADCVPMLLADPQRRAVAAVHAGWRGTLRRIAAQTLGRMQVLFGTRPEDVVAALGPGIGRCCYEVGPEVAQAFAGRFAAWAEWFKGVPGGAQSSQMNRSQGPSTAPPPKNSLPQRPVPHGAGQRLKLDLIAANRWQLLDAGMAPANIVASELCTGCRTDLFFSYRRERGRTGRSMGVIGLRR